MSDESRNIENLLPAEIIELFPEAKLTIRDRLPTNVLLLYTVLNIQKAINNIKYSADEIREIVLAYIAMIPDELRDKQFMDELKKATQVISIDVRPVWCGVKASFEYCRRRGIPAVVQVPQLNYMDMYHAVFNLLMRKQMYLKPQPKEIMTGLPSAEEEIPGPGAEEEEP